MNKILKVALGAVILLGVSATTVSADADKGLKLYSKNLKGSCGISGAVMSSKHTQSEWEEIYNAGTLKAKIKEICPSVTDDALKDNFMIHYYDFFHNFASDSGNVPSC